MSWSIDMQFREGKLKKFVVVASVAKADSSDDAAFFAAKKSYDVEADHPFTARFIEFDRKYIYEISFTMPIESKVFEVFLKTNCGLVNVTKRSLKRPPWDPILKQKPKKVVINLKLESQTWKGDKLVKEEWGGDIT